MMTGNIAISNFKQSVVIYTPRKENIPRYISFILNLLCNIIDETGNVGRIFEFFSKPHVYLPIILLLVLLERWLDLQFTIMMFEYFPCL